MKGKYLITTDNWFIAPDGKSYRAVWGEAQTMTAVEALGVGPNRNSANWMVKIGTDEHHIILAGCQIHYAVSCPDRPYTGNTLQKWADDKEQTLRDGCIYIPEPSEASEKFTFDCDITKSLLGDLEYLKMSSELFREILKEKVAKIGVRSYQKLRAPYQRTYNILQIEWADGTETREILIDSESYLTESRYNCD